MKTVELSKSVDTQAVGPPKSAFPLTAGTASYKGRIEAGGQTIPLTITRKIKEDGAKWVVTETAKIAPG